MIFAVPFLDKNPLKEPERYQYEPLVKLNCLSVDAAADADRAMKKISNRVVIQTSSLPPPPHNIKIWSFYFERFDSNEPN